MFQCDKCGACCRHPDNAAIYYELDRGDGVCRYLENNLCSIYDSRPVICRVDEMYELHFKHTMTKEEYYRQNDEACKTLKELKEK